MTPAESRSAARRSLGYVAAMVATAVAIGAMTALAPGADFNALAFYALLAIVSLVWTFIVDKPKGSSAIAAIVLFGLLWPIAVLLALILVLTNIGSLASKS